MASPETIEVKTREKAPIEDLTPKASITDWPMFRYQASRNAVTPSEAPTSVSILWSNKTDDPQGSYSSPAVVDGKVFFGSTNGKVYAYDALTGKQLWNNTTSSGDYGIDSSPCVSNGYVLVYVNDDDSLNSFNVSTGARRWKVPFTATTAGGSSPVVVGGKVYVGASDGKLYVRNENDGGASWSYSIGANKQGGLGVIASPAISDDTVYFGGGDDVMYAVNMTTHNLRWSYTMAMRGYATPAVTDGVVYYATGVYNGNGCTTCSVYAFDVDGFSDGNDGWSGEASTGATNGDVIWERSMPDHMASSPTVYSDYVFIGSNDGKFYALNKTDGSTIWSYTTNGNVMSSPTVADGMVFITSQDRKVYAFDIEGFKDGNDGWKGEANTGATNGDIIWNYTMPAQMWSSPSISNGVLYINDIQGNVVAIGVPASDTTPPQILTTDPSNNAKNVSLSKTISARFNEAVSQATVTNVNFTLKDGSSLQVTGVVSYNAANNEIRFDPAVDLKAHETYTATISNIKDLFGNTLSVPFTWSFTTVNSKPTLVQGIVSPSNGNLSTIFQFKVIYMDPDNDAPTGDVKLHLDGNATGNAMVVNGSATPATLHDSDYSNGEEFIFNHTFKTAGTHGFQFRATDGIDFNMTQVFTGPQVISVNLPPMIDTVVDQNAEEGVEYEVDLEPFITDPDNTTGQLTLNISSEYLVSITGLVAKFLFPHPAVGHKIIIFTVSDGINTVQGTFRFNVPEIHSPPILTNIDDVIVEADVLFIYNITNEIMDADTPLDMLTVSVNSSHITVGKNTTAIVLMLDFPASVNKELVNVSIGDEYVTVFDDFLVTVHIPPVNQAPTWDALPDAVPEEDIEYTYELAGKFHDDGLPGGVLNLSLKTSSAYTTLNGTMLKMRYPEGVLGETLTINASDGLLGAEVQLKVAVRPVNDAPVLLNGNVTVNKISSKCGGPEKYQFDFTVMLIDVDSTAPSVEVVIDGQSFPMTKGAGNLKTGVQYAYSTIRTDMKKGLHTFVFKVDDKSASSNSQAQTPSKDFEFKKLASKCVDSSLLLWPLIIVAVIIAVVVGVIIAGVLRMRKRKGGQVNPPPGPQGSGQVDLISGGQATGQGNVPQYNPAPPQYPPQNPPGIPPQG